MSAALPPVGPERDRAIALCLGWREDRTYLGAEAARLDEAAGVPSARWVAPDGKIHAAPPGFSTDPGAAALLEGALATRGFSAVTRPRNGRIEAAFVRDVRLAGSFVEGSDQCAALSAAAWLALTSPPG